MTFKKGDPRINRKGRPRNADKARAAFGKTTPANVKWLEKIRDGTAASDEIKMEAVKLMLAYSLGKPPQAVEYSGPDGQPLAAGGGQSIIVNSMAEAYTLAAKAGEDETTLILPRNGFEVGLPPGPNNPNADEFEDGPQEFGRLPAPPKIAKGAEPDKPEAVELLSDEALLHMAAEARLGDVAERRLNFAPDR